MYKFLYLCSSGSLPGIVEHIASESLIELSPLDSNLIVTKGKNYDNWLQNFHQL